MPLERALLKESLSYLKYSLTALAGRYFLLLDHGVPLGRDPQDGGLVLCYASWGLPRLLAYVRRHDGQGRLPADDRQALAAVRAWLQRWPETESGRRWAKPPAAEAAPAAAPEQQ